MGDSTEYTDLLIKQYWEQTNAFAEIALLADSYLKISDLVATFQDELDIDSATGHRLDLIGKIVGLSRTQSADVPVSMQGSTSSQLSDSAYRTLLKMKIGKNVAAAYLPISEDEINIQDVILLAFDGDAYVTDGLDMGLTLHVDHTYDRDTLVFIAEIGLLPKPQAVKYDILYSTPGSTFGFDRDPNSVGFRWDAGAANGGLFARKVVV